MIWLYLVGLAWLLDHAINWYALAGVVCCIVLLMWWAIVNDASVRRSLVPRDDD